MENEVEKLKAQLAAAHEQYADLLAEMRRGSEAAYKMADENAKLRAAMERIKDIASRAELVSYGSWLICVIAESALQVDLNSYIDEEIAASHFGYS
jgi:hypothetical protein